MDGHRDVLVRGRATSAGGGPYRGRAPCGVLAALGHLESAGFAAGGVRERLPDRAAGSGRGPARVELRKRDPGQDPRYVLGRRQLDPFRLSLRVRGLSRRRALPPRGRSQLRSDGGAAARGSPPLFLAGAAAADLNSKSVSGAERVTGLAAHKIAGSDLRQSKIKIVVDQQRREQEHQV